MIICDEKAENILIIICSSTIYLGINPRLRVKKPA
jgi:hypothetical protein